MKVAITGTHGSGKTTLSLKLTGKLKELGINAVLMPEVARDSPYLLAKEQSPAAQLHIFASQVERELRFIRGCEILVIDRSIFDHIAYMKVFFPEETDFLAAEESFCTYYAQTYDYIFGTCSTFDPAETKDEFRPKGQDLQYRAAIEIRKVLERFFPTYIDLAIDCDPVEFILHTMGIKRKSV